VLSSPWKEVEPWFVINLSWYHLLHLGLGALVFVPLLVRPRDDRLRRLHPWLTAALLALLAALLLALDTPIARGVAAGFHWASAADAFMAEVQESQPLLGSGAPGARALVGALGAGVLLLPVAWLAAAFAARRPDRAALLPWVVAAPIAALQAAGQYRFADALAVPLAVLLGWGFVALVGLARRRGGSDVPWPAAAAGLALALLAHWSTLDATVDSLAGPPSHALAAVHERHRGIRDACAWLAARDDLPAGSGAAARGVLASWGHGHVLEWAAGKPTVATNFGAYVGADGFRAPARFFLAQDPHRALEVLAEREVRWVLVTAQLARELPSMIREVDPALATRLTGTADLDAWDGNVTSAWLQTMGARLSFAGVDAPVGLGAGRALPPAPRFLRLVHVTPQRDPQPGLGQLGRDVPVAWVWEHVPGAWLEAHGAAGEELSVALEVAYPTGLRLRFEAAAVVEPSGTARLRVPYATDARNGDGEVLAARWSFGGRTGALEIAEANVRAGGTVQLP